MSDSKNYYLYDSLQSKIEIIFTLEDLTHKKDNYLHAARYLKDNPRRFKILVELQ